jgi:hypothetical protein
MIRSTQWRIVKNSDKSAWLLQNRHILDCGKVTHWYTLNLYKTRKRAVTVGMLMRERGEPISWPGGAIRMGIALVESCKESDLNRGAMESRNWYDTSAELT